MKAAKDSNAVPLQFSSFDTDGYVNLTAPTQISTVAQSFVDVTPTSNDAWIKVTATSTAAVTTQGKLIPFGGFRSVRIPKGHWIASDTEINVVPYGN